jgi:tRNA/rRNA methyltransferase
MQHSNQEENSTVQKRITVILSHPTFPENIGLVARNMKNTGFSHLRLVLDKPLEQKSLVTAVHAREILEEAQYYSDVAEAVADLEIVFAAVARKRKNFSALSLEDAMAKMLSFSPLPKIGLLFGNERSGLSSEELCHSNFRFTIPQACYQPSYNLASAVLLTLFHLRRQGEAPGSKRTSVVLLTRKEQEDCIRLILEKLENKQFIRPVNKKHVTEMVHDLFGRLTLTPRDKKLLLAIFSTGINNSLKNSD